MALDSASSKEGAGGNGGSTRVALNGVAGRMGRQLLAAVIERDDCEISAALEAPGSMAVGADVSLLVAGGSDARRDPEADTATSVVLVSDRVEAIQDDFDVIIDFSVPAATLALLDVIKSAAETNSDGALNSVGALNSAAVIPPRAIVIGTTGFTPDEKKQIEQAAAVLPIVMASNYSVGVTLSLQLLEMTAKALGDDYDVEVIEAHHRNKVDAPSGTALSMGEAVAKGLNRELAECAVYGREGITGVRSRTEIGFETIRAGDIIGDHTVLFAGEGERIEITHRATDRRTFARGAVRAATWVAGQSPGLYDMSDVLGLSND